MYLVRVHRFTVQGSGVQGSRLCLVPTVSAWEREIAFGGFAPLNPPYKLINVNIKF